MTTPFPWQQTMWQQLARHRDRLPHALLLTGTTGIGKAHFAETLAASLICPQPDQLHGMACGHCHACHLLAVGNHPDRLLVAPEKAGKTIKVDAIRQLVQFNALSRYGQGAKVVIIDPADMMTDAAANALLKTLEEPTEGCYLIVISSHPNRLAATLRSRCQRYHFASPPRQVALDWLSQQGVNEAALRLDLAIGAPLHARSLRQEEDLVLRNQLFDAWQRFCQGGLEVTAVSAMWEKVETRQLLWHLKSWISDMLRLKLGGDEATIMNRDLFMPLKKGLPQGDCSPLFACLDEIQRNEVALSHNIALNKRLLVENLLILWQNTLKGVTS